jgi:hypothetical protein
VKTTNDSRTTTTYIVDSNLSIAIPAVGTYAVELMLITNGPTGGTNGRLKVRFNFPTGALTIGHINGKDNTAATTADMTDVNMGAIFNATSSPTADINLPTVNTTVELIAMMHGTLRATATGTLSIDTAQIVASGTTTVRTDSWLTARRMF